MGTLSVPYQYIVPDQHNIQSHAAALAEGLSFGDRVHLGVYGNHVTEDAVFVRFHESCNGIVVAMGSITGMQLPPFLWSDIVELWLLEEKPNIYYSDVPEVAAKLLQLRFAVIECVQANDSAGVLYLLDQVLEAKKAESLFRKAREAVAGIQF